MNATTVTTSTVVVLSDPSAGTDNPIPCTTGVANLPTLVDDGSSSLTF